MHSALTATHRGACYQVRRQVSQAAVCDRPTRLARERRSTGALVPTTPVSMQSHLGLGTGDVPADDLHGEPACQRPPVEVEPDEYLVEQHGGPSRSRPGGALLPDRGRVDATHGVRRRVKGGRTAGPKDAEPLEAAPRRRGIRRAAARTAGPRPGAGARSRRQRRGRSRTRMGCHATGWASGGLTGDGPAAGGHAETPAGCRGLGFADQKGGSSLNCPPLVAALLARSGRAVAHLRLGPTSSASISTIDRLSPAGSPRRGS